jgi:hypothetical protein
MSNTSTTISPSDIIQALIILPIVQKYIVVILYIFGFLGALLNIFILLQKRFRTKSCSTYFLANSMVDFCYINSFLLMGLISLFNLEIFASISSTNLWCKIGNYFYFLLPCLASTYITFASIDRFCASSFNDKLQKFNQLKISYILALIIFLIWSLFSIHILISYDRIHLTPTSPIQCTPKLDVAAIFIIIDGYFFALYNGVIIPICLIIFGLLIFRNVKIIHQRTFPQPILTTNNQRNIRITRGNQNLITMLLLQVSLTILLYIPFVVLYLYGIYNSPPQYSLSLLFYKIFSYIGTWFWFTNFCKTFYINILSSKTFRNILKRRICQLVLSTHHQNRPHQSGPATASSQSPSDWDFSSETPNNPVAIIN